jgi:4'-phosphopantetheinyl transferase EntD
MIKAILPPSVVSFDTFDDIPDGMLFPEEERVIAKAVDKRRREFTTARVCAREAMRLLGKPPVPITTGERGEPQWPVGVVGSITHATGYRGAAVGETARVVSIGIDAERNEALPYGVLDAVSLPKERDEVAALSQDHGDVHWDRLLFSAKESVYKAWFPLTSRWLSFEDALVTFDPVNGTFTARLLVDGPRVHGRRLTGFTGRWLADEGLLLTAIAVLTPVYREAARPLSR